VDNRPPHMTCVGIVLAGMYTQCCKKEIGQQKFEFYLPVPYQKFSTSLSHELRHMKTEMQLRPHPKWPCVAMINKKPGISPGYVCKYLYLI
jgi:hypothetical protein